MAMVRITDDELLNLIAQVAKRWGQIPTFREMRQELSARNTSCSTNRLLVALARSKLDGRRETAKAARYAMEALASEREASRERAARRSEMSVLSDPQDVETLQRVADILAAARQNGREIDYVKAMKKAVGQVDEKAPGSVSMLLLMTS